jgi:hypothetical protein
MIRRIVMHSGCFKKTIVWLVLFFFGGASSGFSGSRIMPTGKVHVFEGQKLVQVLKQESALPNGALLTTEGKCGVRLKNLYLVAEDGTTFGVMEQFDRKDIRLDKGVVYFIIARDIGRLAFLTPAGVLSAVQIRLDAAANEGILKGYLDVRGSQVQLGVLEGGSMVVSTPQSDKVIGPGRQITLAFLDIITDEDKKALEEREKVKKEEDEKMEKEPKMDDAAEKSGGNKIPKKYLIGGGVVFTAALLGLAGGGGDGGGSSSSNPVSPSSPTASH